MEKTKLNDLLRKILKRSDQLDAEECKVWFKDLTDRISHLENENKILKTHVGELQKVIDDFQNMEDKIALAILNRDPNDCEVRYGDLD